MIPYSRELLYNRHRLSHQQIDDLLGEDYSGEYLAEKLQQMEMVREFLRITDSLNEAEIKNIPLKGPVLSYRLYKDTTYRYYKDLDFLLDEALMEKAIAVMYANGYEACYHEWPDNAKKRALFIYHRHHFNVWHPQKGIVVELHWKLNYFQNVNTDLTNQLINFNQKEMELAGRQFTVFNKEFELLYLVIHGGLHDWKRLKWLVDIDRMLKISKIDDEKFLYLTKALKAGRLVALCNAMLKSYFPHSVLLPQDTIAPQLLINFAHSQIMQEKGVEYDSVSGFLKFYRGRMIAFPGLSYKLSVIKQLFFMPEEMDNNPLPSYAVFYYITGLYNKIKRRLSIDYASKITHF